MFLRLMFRMQERAVELLVEGASFSDGVAVPASDCALAMEILQRTVATIIYRVQKCKAAIILIAALLIR